MSWRERTPVGVRVRSCGAGAGGLPGWLSAQRVREARRSRTAPARTTSARRLRVPPERCALRSHVSSPRAAPGPRARAAALRGLPRLDDGARCAADGGATRSLAAMGSSTLYGFLFGWAKARLRSPGDHACNSGTSWPSIDDRILVHQALAPSVRKTAKHESERCADTVEELHGRRAHQRVGRDSYRRAVAAQHTIVGVAAGVKRDHSANKPNCYFRLS
jgi:hypothetical protein